MLSDDFGRPYTSFWSIGQSRSLQTKMVMKGGLLMAIRYASTRFTRDIDFSTAGVYREAQAQELVQEFERQRALAVDRLPMPPPANCNASGAAQGRK